MSLNSLSSILMIVIIVIVILLAILALIYFRSKNAKPKKEKNISVDDGTEAGVAKEKKAKTFAVESVIDFMEFEKVEDNMIVGKNGMKYLMVVECQGINYDLMSEIENGPSSEWILNYSSYNDSIDFYNTYLDKYLSKIATKKIEGNKSISIYLSDGTAFKLGNGSCADITFYINKEKINKIMAEQIPGKDYFSFRICPENSMYNGGKAGGFQTASNGNLSQRMNRDYLLEHCKTPFEDGNTCSALIEFDGWEIKKDYPHRF